MRLILIRHALPERDDAASGTPDPPLSATGHAQVEAMVRALDGERIDAVWSSPLRRARQTAGPLAESRGLEVRTHPGLTEFDFGHGVYVPMEDTSHPSVQGMRQFMDEQDGNEQLQQFQHTVVAGVGDVLTATAPDATVAVACHGGVVNAYVASVLGVREVFFAKTEYTGLTWLTVSRTGRVRLVTLNEWAHLRGL